MYVYVTNLLSKILFFQAANAQEESQWMTAVRKAYQRAIVTPTHHIEQLWKDYENFENSVSRQLVKSCLIGKFLDQDTYIKDARLISDSMVVSPVQIYLDCKQMKGRGEEMAEAVLEKEILNGKG